MPGETDVAVVDRAVVLDIDAKVAGVVVEPQGVLQFHPGATRELASSGNVIVRGRMILRPEGPSVDHRLVFVQIDEEAFVGDGFDVLDTDVGLWVMDGGALDAIGTPKRAWTRTAAGVERGATTVEVLDDPVGWQVGDELVLTPTVPPEVDDHEGAYDLARVSAVEGRMVRLRSALRFDHPAVTVAEGRTYTAEVLNLTRNVRVEGTPTGRAHVFLHASAPQNVKHLALRHLGPRRPGEDGVAVVGRYGLHFHHGEDAVRGSLVEGVVARDIGNHAFVSHLSHGITWRDCITHDTTEDAYWWDPKAPKAVADPDDKADPSDDIVYERCVASLVRPGPESKYRLAGFFLGAGSGSIARGCVAIGVQGQEDGAGFQWPSRSRGVWDFDDCLAHNCRKNGIFVWQNVEERHLIENFVAYHNGGFGISHGAYTNRYHYDGGILYGNAGGGIKLTALSRSEGEALRFSGLLIDSAGLSEFGAVAPSHVVDGKGPTEIVDCSFRGHTSAALALLGEGNTPHLYDVLGCTFDGNALWFDAEVPDGSLVRLQDPVHGSLAVRGLDDAGTPRTEWNASVEEIGAF